MKIILTENQIEFIRRYKKIKDLVDEGIDVLSQETDICDYDFFGFLNEICWQVSDKLEHLNLPTDTVGMIENVHNWVTNNFDEYIRKEFDRVIVDNPNCDEGFDDADDEEYNLQESDDDDDDRYYSTLKSSLIRRHNVIMEEMDHHITNNISCDEYPDDVDEFKDYILEKVTDEMMFNHNVNKWEWHDVYSLLEDMIGKQIKKTFKSWIRKHC
jgi:hypothetical protein